MAAFAFLFALSNNHGKSSGFRASLDALTIQALMVFYERFQTSLVSFSLSKELAFSRKNSTLCAKNFAKWFPVLVVSQDNCSPFVLNFSAISIPQQHSAVLRLIILLPDSVFDSDFFRLLS